MAREVPKPCEDCQWWLPLSENAGVIGGCCCQLYLYTWKRNGMNEDKTECTTWKKREYYKRRRAMTVRK